MQGDIRGHRCGKIVIFVAQAPAPEGAARFHGIGGRFHSRAAQNLARGRFGAAVGIEGHGITIRPLRGKGAVLRGRDRIARQVQRAVRGKPAHAHLMLRHREHFLRRGQHVIQRRRDHRVFAAERARGERDAVQAGIQIPGNFGVVSQFRKPAGGADAVIVVRYPGVGLKTAGVGDHVSGKAVVLRGGRTQPVRFIVEILRMRVIRSGCLSDGGGRKVIGQTLAVREQEYLITGRIRVVQSVVSTRVQQFGNLDVRPLRIRKRRFIEIGVQPGAHRGGGIIDRVMLDARRRFALTEIPPGDHIYDILERLAIHDILANHETLVRVHHAPPERLVKEIVRAEVIAELCLVMRGAVL